MSRTKIIALTAIAPIIWGSTYIVTTEALPVESPLMASTIRALPAGLLLVLLSKAKLQQSWWLKMTALGFLNIGLFFYCLFFAATYLPGGMAALVGSLQPIFVMLLSWFLLKNKLSVTQLIASCLGILGIGLLLSHNTMALDPLGVLVGVIGTLSMSVGVVLNKKWGRPQGMSMLGFTGWQLLVGGLFLLPVTLFIEGVPSELSVTNMIGYGYLSVMGAMVCYYLWFQGIEKLPPVIVSFLGFLSSVSACILGYWFLDQTLNGIQLVGALTILFAIVLAAYQPKEHKTYAKLPVLTRG
ncbi:EamA family transporter [Thalassotalea fusca]